MSINGGDAHLGLSDIGAPRASTPRVLAARLRVFIMLRRSSSPLERKSSKHLENATEIIIVKGNGKVDDTFKRKCSYIYSSSDSAVQEGEGGSVVKKLVNYFLRMLK